MRFNLKSFFNIFLLPALKHIMGTVQPRINGFHWRVFFSWSLRVLFAFGFQSLILGGAEEIVQGRFWILIFKILIEIGISHHLFSDWITRNNLELRPTVFHEAFLTADLQQKVSSRDETTLEAISEYFTWISSFRRTSFTVNFKSSGQEKNLSQESFSSRVEGKQKMTFQAKARLLSF